MTLVRKSTSVSELVPQGYNNWWDYYQTKEAKRRARRENIIIAVAITLLLVAYCVVGNLEVM